MDGNDDADSVVAGPSPGVHRVKKTKEFYEAEVHAILGKRTDQSEDLVMLGRTERWSKVCVGRSRPLSA